jgi:hypothetical protein
LLRHRNVKTDNTVEFARFWRICLISHLIGSAATPMAAGWPNPVRA